MRQSRQWRFVALGLLLSGPAAAQVVWDMKNIAVPPPKFGSTDNKPRPDVWPRLDQGAVLCKTDADLSALAASRRGEQGQRPNCQLIREPTPIKIVKRAGPGQTEVTLTDQNGTDGWTDAYLPDRPPPNTARAVPLR
jgi:hypothetical protein